jgi:hypothetical protein
MEILIRNYCALIQESRDNVWGILTCMPRYVGTSQVCIHRYSLHLPVVFSLYRTTPPSINFFHYLTLMRRVGIA